MKRLTPKEFREQGYLQELNRRFLHPLGLALETVTDDATGEESFGGVWDYRDDPEGIFFTTESVEQPQFKENVWKIIGEWADKAAKRVEVQGCVIQPLSPVGFNVKVHKPN